MGQKKIIAEMNYYLPLIQNNEKNFNFLFRAQSGLGKTSLALIYAQYIGLNKCQYCFPIDGKVNLFLDKKVIVIDEIHTLENAEILYPLMDSNTKTFFLLTNESGSLKEPLVNRCINFIFEHYTIGELVEIAKLYLEIDLPNRWIISLIERSKEIPRNIKINISRLNIILKNRHGITESEFNDTFTNILNISPDGLTEHDRIYINYLSVVKISSLQNIVSFTGIDRDTILREIEPYLIYKKYMIVTTKGRLWLRD